MTLEQAIGRAILLADQQRNRVFVVYAVPSIVVSPAYVVRGDDGTSRAHWRAKGRAYRRENFIAWESE
jgi:hypothetical protein